MLILQGILRAATTLGGGTNKKTGEVIPLRPVLQVETPDNRGLASMTNHGPITGWIQGKSETITLRLSVYWPLASQNLSP